ncbi:glycosyltransferase family 4 protein [Parapedobacter sp. DT-150]|uniref:glycosyltransferase family 4 protein n=1 Tax=Parapedobacter sp. DT-150 TaxID=3396162 RepID=UPI003F1D31BA
MKIVFAPVNRENPYQPQLMNLLSTHGHQVCEGNRSLRQFFRSAEFTGADIIHFHWFEPYIMGGNRFKMIVKIIIFLLKLKQLKKTKKYFWTAHNFKSHESRYPELEKIFLKRFLKLIDKISVHNLFTKDKLIKEFRVGAEKIHVIPHANYIGAYPAASEAGALALKNQLGIDNNKLTFMFLGHIRPYKGVLDIIRAFKELRLDNAQLLICGSIRIREEQCIIEQEILDKNNITLVPNYIEDADMSNYLDLADVMVYPYKNILTSGGLLLGMSYKKACIASNVGSMPEFLDEQFLFSDYADLKNVIRTISFYSKEDLKRIGEANFSGIKDDTWAKMAELTSNLYNKT